MLLLDPSSILLLVTVSALSALSAVFLLTWMGRRNGAPVTVAPLAPSEMPDRIVFLFHGRDLVEATAAGHAFLGTQGHNDDGGNTGGDGWQALLDRLRDEFPQAARFLSRIRPHTPIKRLASGQRHDLHAGFQGDLLHVELVARDGSASVSAGKGGVPDLRELCDQSPMLLWCEDGTGNICWANRAYRAIAEQISRPDRSAPTRVAALFPALERASSTHRASVSIPGRSRPLWFEVTRRKSASGGYLNYALAADPVIQAEEALRNFVQTLTKTFAHLPIGLAIFDRNRQLALFNPALADLTTLEPDWLTGRPTLYEFIDRLRDYRRIPEPKDYKSWRDRIAELEKAAEDGTYEEHWPLPTGQTFRVTGRPHPEGAVAFLFEDITAAITLQRQFRSELALHQAVLDGLDAAVAVFSPTGDLVMNNDAFVALWGVDPGEMLSRMSLDEALSVWKRASRPTSLWQQIALFSAGGTLRQEFSGPIRLCRGDMLELRVKPLSRGAFMCLFHPHVDEDSREYLAGRPGLIEKTAIRTGGGPCESTAKQPDSAHGRERAGRMVSTTDP